MKTFLLFVTATATLTVLAAEPSQNQQQSATIDALDEASGSRLPPFVAPDAMHGEFVRRFEASPGFGLSRVVRPVFRAPVPALVWNGTTYRVTAPELIGLEDDAVAYAPREHAGFGGISTNATRREVRKHFKHRPLTALETNAILAMREGRDLVVLTNRVSMPEAAVTRLDTAPHLFVLGALRASASCAKCHQCEPNELLGAFAYNLAPLDTAPNAPANSSAPRSNLVAWVSAHASRFP